MEFNSNHSQSTSWLDSTLEAFPQETLQEPVPFEDFQFSFGMGSDFSVPLELDLFPSPDPFLHTTTNTVLDENDQKNFSSFLDALFIDPEMSANNSMMNTFNEQEEEQRRSSILQSLDEQKKLHQHLNLMASLPNSNRIPSLMNDPLTSSSSSASRLNNNNNNNDNNSNDHQYHQQQQHPQQQHHQHHQHQHQHYSHQNNHSNNNNDNNNNNPVYLKGDRSFVKKERSAVFETKSGVKRANSETSTQPVRKKNRSHKELLTEEEKRANHIASEQKRRSTIRNGFKDLTDLVPSLKNLNNSKSTVLFKAVEFIHQLEKRNKALHEKVSALELRVQVEGRMASTTMGLSHSRLSQQQSPSPTKQKPVQQKPLLHHELPPPPPLSQSYENGTPSSFKQVQSFERRRPSNSSHSVTSSGSSSSDSVQTYQGLSSGAKNALLAHKSQQNQLLKLQEQLQKHQRLIAQQQEMKEKALKSVTAASTKVNTTTTTATAVVNKLPPILGKFENGSYSLLQELEDNAISAP